MLPLGDIRTDTCYFFFPFLLIAMNDGGHRRRDNSSLPMQPIVVDRRFMLGSQSWVTATRWFAALQMCLMTEHCFTQCFLATGQGRVLLLV